MPSEYIEKLAVFIHSPNWGRVGVWSVIIGGITGALLYIFTQLTLGKVGVYSTITPAIFGILITIASNTASRFFPATDISCMQTRPSNSIENHHKEKYRLNSGVGFVETYMDPPSWVTEFKVGIYSENPDIELTTLDNKPNSVRYEDGVLKSDQRLEGFPLTMKMTGEPEELAEGEYILRFRDEKANNLIKEITLKCDPEPPDDAGDGGEERLEEWM